MKQHSFRYSGPGVSGPGPAESQEISSLKIYGKPFLEEMNKVGWKINIVKCKTWDFYQGDSA